MHQENHDIAYTHDLEVKLQVVWTAQPTDLKPTLGETNHSIIFPYSLFGLFIFLASYIQCLNVHPMDSRFQN